MGIEALLYRTCTQTAVYWGDPVPDGYGGQTFGSQYPIEISCRWEQRRELIKDAQGNEVITHSRVYVTQDVEEGGWLFLGTLDDLDSSEEDDPRTVDGAYEIVKFDKTPSLASTVDFIHIAYLSKLKRG